MRRELIEVQSRGWRGLVGHLCSCSAKSAGCTLLHFSPWLFTHRLLALACESQAEGSAEASAALVHFGWAPGVRAAHAMFGAVARYGEQSTLVSGEPHADDFLQDLAFLGRMGSSSNSSWARRLLSCHALKQLVVQRSQATTCKPDAAPPPPWPHWLALTQLLCVDATSLTLPY